MPLDSVPETLRDLRTPWALWAPDAADACMGLSYQQMLALTFSVVVIALRLQAPQVELLVPALQL